MALFGGITLPDRPDPENVRRLDLLPIPMIRGMMRYGIRIDPEHFQALSAKFQARMTDLRREISNYVPADKLEWFVDASPEFDTDDDTETTEDVRPEFNIDSAQKIGELLYDVLRLHLTASVNVKKTKSGDRLSTGKKTLEQLKREHPVVPLILEYRECSKLDGTYAKSMPRRARFHPRGADCPLCGRKHYSDEWRVHTQILTTRTATGRTANKAPNLSNIPTRTKAGQEIRAGFIASDGHVIVQRDWAQIELRLMADRSGDPIMVDVYSRDGDIHITTALGTFPGLTEADMAKGTPGELLYRAPAKAVNFSVVYLISAPGLLDLMAVTFATAGQPLPSYMTEAWCDDFILKWFDLYKGARRYLTTEEEKIRRYGIAWTPSGRVRRIPEVRSAHNYIQEAGVRQGSNHGIQGYSADLMKLAMGEAHQASQRLQTCSIPTYPLLTIYDELLIETEEDSGETVSAMLEEVMDNVLTDKSNGRSLCRVPIKSDGKLLVRWKK